jgi:hypothetical protein
MFTVGISDATINRQVDLQNDFSHDGSCNLTCGVDE